MYIYLVYDNDITMYTYIVQVPLLVIGFLSISLTTSPALYYAGSA